MKKKTDFIIIKPGQEWRQKIIILSKDLVLNEDFCFRNLIENKLIRLITFLQHNKNTLKKNKTKVYFTKIIQLVQ